MREREFKIRLRSSPRRVHLDSFTFCAVKCNYAFCLPSMPCREACIIIYSIAERGEKREREKGRAEVEKCGYCYSVQGAQRYPIFPSHCTGNTFICVVKAIPCPPTKRGGREAENKRIPPAPLFSLWFISEFLIVSNRRDRDGSGMKGLEDGSASNWDGMSGKDSTLMNAFSKIFEAVLGARLQGGWSIKREASLNLILHQLKVEKMTKCLCIVEASWVDAAVNLKRALIYVAAAPLFLI